MHRGCKSKGMLNCNSRCELRTEGIKQRERERERELGRSPASQNTDRVLLLWRFPMPPEVHVPHSAILGVENPHFGSLWGLKPGNIRAQGGD